MIATMTNFIFVLLSNLLAICHAQQIPNIGRPTFSSLHMTVPGKIVMEEHISTSIFSNISNTNPFYPKTGEQPYTVQIYQEGIAMRLNGSSAGIEARVQEMDAANISLSILSLTTPAIQGIFNVPLAIEYASAVNNETAAIYKMGNHSNRFEFWCQAPFQDGNAAAAEAERCVKDLGGVGIWSNGYTNNNSVNAPIYLDNPIYDVFWTKLQELNVPLYIHPREQVPQAQVSYEGYEFLAGSTLGFSVETMIHALRIMLSGTLDKWPNVRVVLGHAGEGLPFYIDRMKQRMRHMCAGQWAMKYDLPHYWQNNFWVTTSGVMSLNKLQAVIGSVGDERVMFSADYPYEDYAEQGGWFDGLELPTNVKEKIGFRNAMALFGWDK